MRGRARGRRDPPARPAVVLEGLQLLDRLPLHGRERARPHVDVRLRGPGRHRLDLRPGAADGGDGPGGRPTGPAFECNTGFLRKDAILVVTIVTDEDDNFGDGSAGNAAGWKASLVAAKKGDEKALVVLGLYGDNDQPNGICGPLVDSSGAEPSPRIREFVESFGDQGISGSVCAPSYDSFFSEAVGLIAQTCDDFVPPPM
ncbi:hypothetical protein [Nannocystis pusilla]|uniref:hypothetical protein n=1 Tax=Nannocystis pusilla TaxID=889268 RepID=UPI003B824768